MAEVIIRSANPDDFPKILELFREFAAFENLSELMVNSVERMMQEQEHFHCFVAETGRKEIIGYATWFFCYYTWTGKSIYMDDLFVKPEYRRKGIGLRLIEQVIEFGKSSQCHKLRWQVSNWNQNAIAFYKGLGAVINPVEQNCDLSLD
ncbi:MAG: GNAT family N-acetyltransferase [Prolixibacteraceae bacterium]